ncbi:GCN5-like N-acetyltransferase, partial [Streptomyces zinciresistens K42]
MDADPRAAAPPYPAGTGQPLDQPTTELRIPRSRGVTGGVSTAATVRFMDAAHLPFVVTEHRRLFPDGFFSRLGPGFLTAHTRTYLTSPHAVGFIAELNGEPVGYLVGIVDPPLHRRQLLRAHGAGLAVRAAGALTLRPALLARFLRTRLPRYVRKLVPRRSGPPAPAPAPGPVSPGREAVLAHVAVSERARSYGIGGELIARFTDFAVLAGCTRMSLVTSAGADGAGPYYERRGWQRSGASRTPDGKDFRVYV